MIEATCGRCAATVIPADEHDTEHAECGGHLRIEGTWTR